MKKNKKKTEFLFKGKKGVVNEDLQLQNNF